MGRLFKYISDELIDNHDEEGECPVCGREAKLFDMDCAPNADEWDVNEDRVDEMCADCIRRIPLRKLSPREPERLAQQIINQKYPKGSLSGQQRQEKWVGLCDEFRRTPEIALFLQGEDWPSCCGDFVELIGSPETEEEAIRIGREMDYWDHRPASFTELYGDMTLEPEDLEEINIFRCLSCDKKVFIWQCT